MRIREPLVLSDAKAEGPFAADSVVQARRIRSVLCVPLYKQAEALGLLYLENNAMRDAFTMERVEVVRVLAAQAAISLENSLLQAESERSARALRDTNAELERRLGEIEKANLEIQNSRRAALNLMQDAVRSQEALRKWEYIFNHAGWAVASAHPESGALELVNPAFAKMHGYTVEELIGRPLADTFAPESRAELPWHVATAHAQDDYVYESLHIRKDGSVFPVLTHVSALKDETGRVLYLAATFQDITERKRAEEALKQKTVEAEEASRLKSQFVSNVSHELRTPLNAILGYSALLSEEVFGALNQEQKGPLEGIQRNAKELLHLINDVLDLSRIEAGKLPIHPERLNIDLLLKEVVAGMKPLLEKKGLQIQWNLPQSLPSIESDAGKVKQIVTNLLSNAIKFTLKGKITIAAGDQPEKEGVRITIADTGIGIKPEELAKIFDSFHQADAEMTREFGGVGLGLAIVKELVGLLKGEITVESEFGKRSTFTVFLPYRFERRGEKGA